MFEAPWSAVLFKRTATRRRWYADFGPCRRYPRLTGILGGDGEPRQDEIWPQYGLETSPQSGGPGPAAGFAARVTGAFILPGRLGPPLDANSSALIRPDRPLGRSASLAGLAGWVIATQLLGLGFCGIQFYGLSVLRLRLGLGFGYALAFATPGSCRLDRYQRARANLHFARA